MTQEEKDLLLIDLCSRLPYGVKCKDEYAQIEGKLCQIGTNYNMCLLLDENGESKWANVSNCKPYLYPLSSMTDEQEKEYHRVTKRWIHDSSYSISGSIDWLNANYFDYRNLIEKGLAINCTNLNIY